MLCACSHQGPIAWCCVRAATKDLEALVKRLELRIHALETGSRGAGAGPGAHPVPSPAGAAAAPSAQSNGAESGGEEEDDFELFGDEVRFIFSLSLLRICCRQGD